MGTLKEIVNTDPKFTRRLVEERRFEGDDLPEGWNRIAHARVPEWLASQVVVGL